MPIFTNCGEYLPFQAPIPPCPPLPPTNSATFIPVRRRIFSPFELEDPRPYYEKPRPSEPGSPGSGDPGDAKWKCQVNEQLCGPGSYRVTRICKQCNGEIGLDGTPNPNQNDPGCSFNSLAECQISCVTDPACFSPTNNNSSFNVNVNSFSNDVGYSNLNTNVSNNESSFSQNSNVNSNLVYNNLLNITSQSSQNQNSVNIFDLASNGQFSQYPQFESNNTLYDLKRNFFKPNSAQQTTRT
ncbi:MAG: hypothetical protein RL348_1789, partial [Bacteroidota bacterium]